MKQAANNQVISSLFLMFSSERGKLFEHIMDILELIEPIIDSKVQVESNMSRPQITNVAKPLKTKKNVRKGKGL